MSGIPSTDRGGRPAAIMPAGGKHDGEVSRDAPMPAGGMARGAPGFEGPTGERAARPSRAMTSWPAYNGRP
jgi:hypothetical protein